MASPSVCGRGPSTRSVPQRSSSAFVASLIGAPPSFRPHGFITHAPPRPPPAPPAPRALAELRSEVEAVVPGRLVRRVSEWHLRRRPAPRLVGEGGAIHSDHLVGAIRITTLARYQEDRGTLVRGEPLSVDEELVALRFAAEDRVVVDDKAAPAFVFLDEDRGGESADSAAHGDEVVHLAGVDGVGDTLFERAIAHPVSGAQYIPGVAVGVSVVANAAVAVEAVGGGDRWRFTVEEQSGAGDEGAIEEVAAGDRLPEGAGGCARPFPPPSPILLTF